MKNLSFYTLGTLLLCLIFNTLAAAQNIDIPGPAGSNFFGQQVRALPNGNIVVTDSVYSIPAGAASVGAVYLYNGATGALISTLTGSTPNDAVGNSGITVLSNGNYVINSPSWDNGAFANAGAVTWCSQTTGCSGAVSAANSLVGSTANNSVGSSGITILSNGNYVVRSPSWDNGATANVGAATWGNGTTGVSGTISAANSLIGSTTDDNVGNAITALPNGNYVVSSFNWDNGAIGNAGAATWCNGTTGRVGTISVANSLVGSTASDQIGGLIVLTNGNFVLISQGWDNGATANVGAATWGNGTTGVSGTISAANSLIGSTTDDNVGNAITALSNGNYVVRSANWDNGALVDVGAVTWGNGATGTVGAVSPANSLFGSTASDRVGNFGVSNFGVTALTNGNYVVRSINWDNGAISDAGAVTWGNGATGTVGAVSAANSLVGSTANGQIGNGEITVLSNGNYVVRSPSWDNGATANVGAATWGNGTTGVSGTISAANSLIGSTTDDNVSSSGIFALTNGNYVVGSPSWDNGALVDVGAATWCNGTTGRVGTISVANSLVGSIPNDFVTNGGVFALTNGNYVVGSPSWDNGAIANVGAATWGNGTTGRVGTISVADSFVGSTADDNVGGNAMFALSNGNYVVRSPNWDNGAIGNAGAVTWGNGATGTVGAVSVANSLVGSTANDMVGTPGIIVLSNGNYIVFSWVWNNGGIIDAGAVTRGIGSVGTSGVINSTNSVFGTTAGGGNSMTFSFDAVNNQLVVGRPFDNIVTLLRGFAPTAAGVSVSGTVVNGKSGIARAIVSVTDAEGNVRTARTNSFGVYKFENLPAGATYVFNVAAKGFEFAPQIVTLSEAVENLDFEATE